MNFPFALWSSFAGPYLCHRPPPPSWSELPGRDPPPNQTHTFTLRCCDISLYFTFSDKKQHRNGIKRPKSYRYPSLKGVCKPLWSFATLFSSRVAEIGEADPPPLLHRHRSQSVQCGTFTLRKRTFFFEGGGCSAEWPCWILASFSQFLCQPRRW